MYILYKTAKITLDLTLMDPCIVDYSVEIPTRCSFVIEFIIPEFFLKAQHVSSGRPLIIRSSKLYLQPLVYIRMWWPAVVKSEWELDLTWLDYGRSPHAYVNQRQQIQLELLKMSGVPLETCWAFNERWNNKFCYKVASCWLFLLNHTTMHGSMNIKKKP